MRDFNAQFDTERAKRGCAPLNLLEFGFTEPVWLADRGLWAQGDFVAEDYSAYEIQEDPEESWSKSASTITVTRLYEEEAAYIARALPGPLWTHTGFEHRVRVKIGSGTSACGLVAAWALTPDAAGRYSDAAYHMTVWAGKSGYVPVFCVEVTGAEWRMFTSAALSADTSYWLRIMMSAALKRLYVLVYSDSGYTTLVDTIYAEAPVKRRYRYLYAMSGGQTNCDTDRYFYGEIGDLVIERWIPGLVTEWGFLDSSMAQTPGRGVLGTIEQADLSLSLANVPVGGVRFSDNFVADDPPENVDVTLYQTFKGLAFADKEILFKGVVRGQPEYDLTQCRLSVMGVWARYADRMLGENLVVNATDWPNADPDDIGKMACIVYGACRNVPCRAVKAGALTALTTDLTKTATSVVLTGAAAFPASGTVQIDDEKITYTGKSGNTLTGCTRGASGTTAVAHDAGAKVAQVLTEYVYLIAGHPVKTVSAVYVEGTRLASGYTAYTGQSGDELTGYAGKAVVKFTALPVLRRQVAIEATLNDGSVDQSAFSIATGSHAHTGAQKIIVWQFDCAAVTYGTVYNAWSLCDGPLTTGAQWETDGAQVTVSKARYEAYDGTPMQYRICLYMSGTGTLRFSGFGVTLDFTGSGKSIWYNVPTWLDTWAEWNNATATIKEAGGSFSNLNCTEVWIEISYMPTVSASPATGVAKSGTLTVSETVNIEGNSVADTVIGGAVTADAEGYGDDASGTYTGTANALITRPDHVFKHLLLALLGFPSADLDTTALSAAGSFYGTNSYTFGFCLDRPWRAADLFARLALQCRSRFFVSPQGKARLIVRQTGQISGHAIAKNEIVRDSVSVSRSPAEDILNRINAAYNRDCALSWDDPASYSGSVRKEDATSQTRYGVREWTGERGLFCFFAVTSATMAGHVAQALLDFHRRARRIVRFSVFLDNSEIEPGDVIDVTHDLDSMSGFVVEVLKTVHRLGSAKKGVMDTVEVVGIENAA
jgi:hypothetical protein